MNNNISTQTVKTMSSLELVKIINDLREEGQAVLRHNDFTEKVRKVLGSEAAKFSAPLKTASGQTAQGYNLPKREANLMVMSESYKVQAAVYDRMVELEEKQPAIDPMKLLNNPEAMRGLLLSYTEKVIALEEEVAILEPKAQALDRLSAADGSMNITAAAKVLKMQPTHLFKLLSEKRWIYKRVGGKTWLGYQDKIQAGYLEHHSTEVSRTDGTKKVVEQVLVTAKGLTKLSTLLNTQPTLLDRAISLVTGKRNGLVVIKGGAK